MHFGSRPPRWNASLSAKFALFLQWLRLAPVARSGTMLTVLAFGTFAIVVVLFEVVSPLTDALVAQWSRHDVELRAEMINTSAGDRTEHLLAARTSQSVSQATAFFERLTRDERLVALAVCDRTHRTLVATHKLPAGFSCEMLDGQKESNVAFRSGARRLLVSAFAMETPPGASLVVIHDLSFAATRQSQARLYLSLGFAAIIAVAIAAAALFLFLLLRRWRAALSRTVADLRAGRRFASLPAETWGKELREALEQYDLTRRTLDGIHVDWSPGTLARVLNSELPDAQVIAVSNREPYIHNYENGKVVVQNPASGLVAAMEPVIRACKGTWIAHGSGSADVETVGLGDRIAVPPGAPEYTLRRIWLTAEEQDGYYYGLANEGLWPLCHIAYVRPIFREEDWKLYVAVNEKFADAVVAEARSPDPVVLVQDYHFALLPRMLRERLPRATIVTFWHIPWPNAESFGVCPWRREIIEGLLGSSILGFHTQFHCNNFLETVDRFVESRIDREWRAVVHRGSEVLVRPYPISIEWPPRAMAGQGTIAQCRANVRAHLGLADNVQLGVGIERFDYTKGILDRIRAVDAFLSNHPEWKGRYCFVQAAAPTRSKLSSYRALQEDAIRLVDEVNARHGVNGWKPIVLSIRHHEPSEVFELFRAADHCIVSSLHDGMNLVAKEFVAARDDEAGVLILSNFAGASRELSEALLVNPYHASEMADAIHRALTMPRNEQQARMQLMRSLVRSHNVYAWAGQMLLDAARLRRKLEIENIAAARVAKSRTSLSVARRA
jgi:trehalose-6-phosphate synthase